MNVVTSISALGTGSVGRTETIRYGDQTRRLMWSADDSCWLSDSQELFTLRDTDQMNFNGISPAAWNYVSSVSTTSQISQDTNEPLRGSRPWGWNPRAIRAASAGFAAGMTLEVNLTTCHWGWAPGSSYDCAVVMYPLGPGDQISPAIVPDDYVVVSLAAIATVRAMHSSGWTTWPLVAPTTYLLAPHLYARYNSGTNSGAYAEYVSAQARWKGTP
jgi:hypothetical protein